VLRNVAGGDGGGLYNTRTTRIRDSRFRSNVAAGQGGGIFNLGDLSLVGVASIGNRPNYCTGC
jgi:predicted outer membrane repeat protein